MLALLLAPFMIVAVSLGMQRLTPTRPTQLPVSAEIRAPVLPTAAPASAIAPQPKAGPAAGPLSTTASEAGRPTALARRAAMPERAAAAGPSQSSAAATPAPVASFPIAPPEIVVPAPGPVAAILPPPAPSQAVELPVARPAGRETCDAPAGLLAPAMRVAVPVTPALADPTRFGAALAAAAHDQLNDVVIYNARYARIAYPLGDVAPIYGVCTDVVVRAYRALGIDLQQLIFTTKSGRGDAHIDHRRVDVVRRFLDRFGEKRPLTEFPEDYLPGDIVTYYRPQNRSSTAHVAIVSDRIAPSGRLMIIHNRGWGPQLEDALFVDKMTGHYRFSGMKDQSPSQLIAASLRRPGQGMPPTLQISRVGTSGHGTPVSTVRPMASVAATNICRPVTGTPEPAREFAAIDTRRTDRAPQARTRMASGRGGTSHR